VNRKRGAEKQNAGRDPARKRCESPTGFPLQYGAAAEEPLARFIRELTGEPGVARYILFGLIDVVHYRKIRRSVSRGTWKGYNTLVLRDLHKREPASRRARSGDQGVGSVRSCPWRHRIDTEE
jgi:hypothetical protein